MKLNRNELKNKEQWIDKGIKVPNFDVEKVKEKTVKNPKWLHFGAGNIFRAFVASCQDELLEKGLSDHGIIAVETFDGELIDKIYAPHDNLALVSILKETGTVENKIVASVVESHKGSEYETLESYFKNPELQMVSYTITEKGYAVKDAAGELLSYVKGDMANDLPSHAMVMLTKLLHTRYLDNKEPVSIVSMDNCSHNGDKIKDAVNTIADVYIAEGKMDKGFLDYVNNKETVGFPLSMIDKITPRPAELVAKQLEDLGFEDTGIVVTSKNTFMAPFVNAEETQYLVIEDLFPNGRPSLEKSTGVMFTDRETVNNVETMKVTTCLNPLHTALAVFGCLLGHKTIADEMKDPELSKLVKQMAYNEGLKAVVDPGIIDPMQFVDEVINKRFSNPFIEDTPQRIATDTSQKVGIRYGVTIKSYIDREDLNIDDLKLIPLVIAGWLRYLDGVDDFGNAFTLSPDPLMDRLMKDLDNKKNIISDVSIFGNDLYSIGLGEKIESIYNRMTDVGSIRSTLIEYVN